MLSNRQVFDYESLPPSAPRGKTNRGAFEDEVAEGAVWPTRQQTGAPLTNDDATAPRVEPVDALPAGKQSSVFLRRGHGLTYIALFLFTVFLYIRPYEFIPALAPLSRIAFPLGVITLLIFLPSQLILEGTLTARPREVNLLLLFLLTAILSVVMASNRLEAWETFNSVFIKAVLMFFVLVNVARTERRLKQLLLIAIVAGCALSVSALKNYLAGNFSVEGYRVKGNLGGWMDNPNDMAIHFVTMIPIAIALLFAARNPLKKLCYGASVALMAAATVVTFSRGAFLALALATTTLCYKLGRRNKMVVVAVVFVALISFLVLVPANYSDRLISIVDHSRDPNGSAGMRQQILIRSIQVAIRHPVFGVGMGNFHTHSIRELVSHNSYTEVASEMGLAALVFYMLFMVTPFRRLGQIERETFGNPHETQFYYLAIGLQAALVAYLVNSFFASVAYIWFIYYLVGFALCLRRLYESKMGREVIVGKISLFGKSRQLQLPAEGAARSFPTAENESQWSGSR